MPDNSITIYPFSAAKLQELMSGSAVMRGEELPQQVEYLGRYCEQLGVKTLVRESHYIDRHYVDEYALYYSRMLSPPGNSVERIHFFGWEFSEEKLKNLLEQSFRSTSDREAAEKELMQTDGRGYLGYSSVRPIRSVPVGRTILARLPDKVGKRDILATSKHHVHLANLRLAVDGLAFQQQDAAVGACATAALWTALVRIARHDGMRAPTPAEISEAASRPTKSQGRRMLPVNDGLTVQQLCEATRAFGFVPEVVSAVWPEFFMAALHTYLSSGIPVVLALRAEGSGHAVTAVGFQMGTTDHPRLKASVPVRSSRIAKIYVHDDRVGPYARATLEPYYQDDLGDILVLSIGWDGGAEEQWLVDCAVTPVYPKLRLSMASLLSLAELVAAPIEQMVGASAPMLRVDFKYERSGEYLTGLSGRVQDPARAAAISRKLSLSRWCAIVRWYIEDEELLELIYDTTDLVRDAHMQNESLLRAVIIRSAAHSSHIEILARGLGAPCI